MTFQFSKEIKLETRNLKGKIAKKNVIHHSIRIQNRFSINELEMTGEKNGIGEKNLEMRMDVSDIRAYKR